MSKKMVVIIGLPRSGKDTVAQWIVQNYDARMIQVTTIVVKPVKWFRKRFPNPPMRHIRDDIHGVIHVVDKIFRSHTWLMWWWAPIALLARNQILVINSPRRLQAEAPLRAIARLSGREIEFIGCWSPAHQRWERTNADTSGKDAHYPALEGFEAMEAATQGEVEIFRNKVTTVTIMNDSTKDVLLSRAEEAMREVLKGSE